MESSEAYQELCPTLFGALGELARQGLSASPSDSLDLIHDFFLQAWPAVSASCKNDNGRSQNYTCAFIHFARPRILRLRRLDACLVGMEDVSRFYHASATAEATTTSPAHNQVLDRALRELSESEREILRNYIMPGPSSERLLAKTLFLSRYRLRELVLKILGRLVSLVTVRKVTDPDCIVACLLWLEQRTIQEAAAILNISQQQVRRAEVRNAAWIARGLARGQVKRRRFREPYTYPAQKQQTVTAGRLLRDALLSPGKNELLSMTRARARDVLVFLDTADSFAIGEPEIATIDPVWIAQIYGAIAEGAESMFHKDADVLAALLALDENDESTVGSAFKETLIADLPPSLLRFQEWFVAMIDEDELQNTLKSPGVCSGAPESVSLAIYGITPMTILCITQTVSRFFHRLMRMGTITGNSIAVRGSQFFARNESGEQVNFTMDVLNEIIRSLHCPSQSSVPLLQWLLQVAAHKPYIFPGFRFEMNPTSRQLVRTGHEIANLYERWGVGSLPGREPAQAGEPCSLDLLKPAS